MKNMLKKIIVLTYIAFILGGFFIPTHFSLAQVTPCAPGYSQVNNRCVQGYQLLAPLPGVPTTFYPQDENALGSYLNMAIKVIIGLAAVLAVVMIVIGGLEYMTSELISSKEAGKEKIQGALLGLLLALGSYALLFTINPDLLNTKIIIPDATVQVVIDDEVPQTPVNGKYTSGNLPYSVGEAWAPRAGAAADLSYSGATVYNTQCTTVGQLGCTSTRGLNPSNLNTIHQNCSTCVLSIQGGTEFWAHGGGANGTSHQIGSSTVDLGVTPTLTQYIMSGQASGQNPVFHNWYNKDGLWYYYEGNHWHASGASKS